MGAYDVVFFRGHRFDRMTVQALLVMEKHLGYELNVMQGSYNGHSVGASAGTHAGGGAVDLSAVDAHDKVRAGREFGHFAMWERQELWHGGTRVWPHHVHGILIGNAKAAPIAKGQVHDYYNHRNGLAGHAPDNTWHPAHITPFRYSNGSSLPMTVDLSNLRVDFANGAEGHSNTPRRGVKIIQRRLNKVHRANLRVDGEAGPKTLDAWKKWERHVGRPANTLPDAYTVLALLKGSGIRMVP